MEWSVEKVGVVVLVLVTVLIVLSVVDLAPDMMGNFADSVSYPSTP